MGKWKMSQTTNQFQISALNMLIYDDLCGQKSPESQIFIDRDSGGVSMTFILANHGAG